MSDVREKVYVVWPSDGKHVVVKAIIVEVDESGILLFYNKITGCLQLVRAFNENEWTRFYVHESQDQEKA